MRYSVLFHIDEENKWPILLANVRNLIDDLNDVQLMIDIVINGPAVLQLSDVHILEKMKQLETNHVQFLVCRNALRSNRIAEQTLEPFLIVVPAGISEIVKKQARGFLYVKP